MMLENYSKPKVCILLTIASILSAIYVALLLILSLTVIENIKTCIVILGVFTAIDMVGAIYNKGLNRVYIYRPLSGVLCLLRGHEWFIIEEWLYTKRAMISCSRCGANSFNDKIEKDDQN